MKQFKLWTALLLTGTFCQASPDNKLDCADGFTICSPPGATSEVTPQIGDPIFQNLFNDIVSSSLPTSNRLQSSGGTASLCCVSSLSCLTVANLAIPFCYDKFTTNYFLPDGSYGTVVGGQYTSSGRDTANLETGEYTLVDGKRGNIYSDNPTAKPDLGVLPIPTQFTASGIGPAIPASALGGQVTLTYTTTISGSTIPPVTIAPSTIPESATSISIILPSPVTKTISNNVVTETTVIFSISLSTRPGSTIPRTTLSGSTVPPKVTTIITTEIVSSPRSSTIASSTSTNKNDAAWLHPGPMPRYVVILLFSLILL